VATLTTIIFPFIFVDLPHIINYYPVVFARDLLMVAIVLMLLYYGSRNKAMVGEEGKSANHGVVEGRA